MYIIYFNYTYYIYNIASSSAGGSTWVPSRCPKFSISQIELLLVSSYICLALSPFLGRPHLSKWHLSSCWGQTWESSLTPVSLASYVWSVRPVCTLYLQILATCWSFLPTFTATTLVPLPLLTPGLWQWLLAGLRPSSAFSTCSQPRGLRHLVNICQAIAHCSEPSSGRPESDGSSGLCPSPLCCHGRLALFLPRWFFCFPWVCEQLLTSECVHLPRLLGGTLFAESRWLTPTSCQRSLCNCESPSGSSSKIASLPTNAASSLSLLRVLRVATV